VRLRRQGVDEGGVAVEEVGAGEGGVPAEGEREAGEGGMDGA
jgi:hypothetical protein